MKQLLFLLICLFFLQAFFIFGQEADDANAIQNEIATEAEERADTEEAEEGPESSYIEMDIRTSTLSELASWCRELGLSEGGTRESLSARLREYYGLRPPQSTAQAGQRIITIESAKTTEYFTLEVVDEEYARLKGDVIISLKDGNAIHRIKAWEVLYNRTRNVMTATGNVEYVKEEGSTTETFKGQSITVNLDTWSSIFMDGSSEKAVSGKSSAYRFAGTVISRNDEEVTVLTNATITNPANAEAHWSLHASKLWLLPGNDWAILNAVLKVGEIPLLYLPFFFYPADEIVFHPALGTRSREGTFLQTTTYILGRPRSTGASENSLTRIFGGDSENAVKTREGVFLRTTGEKKVDPALTQLSLILDAYVNLGIYLGTEASLPGKGIFAPTKISAGLGLTRDIYIMGGDYTPFQRYDGSSDWNSSNLFSLDIPLRFRLNLSGAFNINNGSLSWQIPHYSDPYVDRDFMRRTEVLDWLSMLREGTDTEAVDDTSISSYEWKLWGSLNPNVSSANPYITSLTIPNITSSLLFNQRLSSNYQGPYAPANPGRAFYFPDRLTILSISASLSGNLLRSGNITDSQTETEDKSNLWEELLPDFPISPWAADEEETNDTQDENSDAYYASYLFTPPALGQKFSLPGLGDTQLSLDYSLVPTAASEMQFRTGSWRNQEDVNWGDVSSVLGNVRSEGSLGFTVNNPVIRTTLQLTGTGSWQNYIYMNESAEEFNTAYQVKAAKDRVYNETYFTSYLDLNTTIRPFTQDPVWGNSNMQYILRGLFGKTTVDTSGSDPTWTWDWGSWDKTNIVNHQATANLAARVMDYNQNLSVTAVLPPKDSQLTGNATFRAWITETALSSGVLFPLDEEERVINPVQFTETLKFGSLGSFVQQIKYDPEKGEYTTFTSTLSLSGLSASFSAVYGYPSQYNYNGSINNSLPNGWVFLDEERLYPQDFKLGYVKTFSSNNLWGKRLSISLSVNTSLVFDLQRYTNSSFAFGLRLRMGITSFLDLDFSTNSQNDVIFKYFQGLPIFDLPTELYQGQEQNFFVDLFNSFRFDNDDLRRQSGFKMKAMNLSLIHHLGDWNAKLSMTMTPYLEQGSREYKFANEISFLIQWVPIGEIRSQIDYIKEELTVK